jgi:hypothetical protein
VLGSDLVFLLTTASHSEASDVLNCSLIEFYDQLAALGNGGF